MFKGICSNFVFVITGECPYFNFTLKYSEYFRKNYSLKGFGFTFTGHNKDQIDYRMLETIMKHVPAGTSTNVLVHYGQEINSSENFIPLISNPIFEIFKIFIIIIKVIFKNPI